MSDAPPLLAKYLALTEAALGAVHVGVPRAGFLAGASEDFLGMARSYLADARHFLAAGDPERALAAVSYAHGWIDAGVRLGLLDAGGDDQRFTPFR
ncbi:MAG TPA: DUF357 domain-containing protein [Thermoplasmata archaeon]|nr:DUF357 domain-containing protein [Thermoplasmata archaeon]